MKIILSYIILTFCYSFAVAQEQVSWDVTFDADQSEVFVRASIDEGWHLYSSEKVADLGPIPTEVVIHENDGVEVVGKLKEPKPKVSYDPNFGETLYYFEEAVTFTQAIELKGATELSGTITYMVCNDEMCMPPVDYKFSIELTHEN
ncbi:MAG: protein-disulfide reductase DsbD N-terminal domain-containing protein [bacterium]|nr:protein-disulfide reductase DsbD N-terminal domain-containing protein [bacterium]